MGSNSSGPEFARCLRGGCENPLSRTLCGSRYFSTSEVVLPRCRTNLFRKKQQPPDLAVREGQSLLLSRQLELVRIAGSQAGRSGGNLYFLELRPRATRPP
jgi:hypothetical protein